MNLINKLNLCWRILRRPTGDLYAHAERELPKSQAADDMQFDMNRCVLELIHVFSTQGHSGFSASYATSQIEKLLRYEPLGPLLGTDDEWVEVGHGIFQNNRCGRVFKENGQAYDIDGKVFRGADGAGYTNSDSRVNVTFPYTPHTEYVEVAP